MENEIIRSSKVRKPKSVIAFGTISSIVGGLSVLSVLPIIAGAFMTEYNMGSTELVGFRRFMSSNGETLSMAMVCVVVPILITSLILYFIMNSKFSKAKDSHIVVTSERVYGIDIKGRYVDIPVESIKSVSVVKDVIKVSKETKTESFLVQANAEDIQKVINSLIINK